MVRSLRYIRWALGIIAGILISLTAILYFIDFNQYRGVLAAQLSQALGRPLQIHGDLKLQLGLHTGISARDISMREDAADDAPEMARIGRLSLGLALMPLLQRQVEIDRLVLEGVEILIHRDASGDLNWAIETADDGGAWTVPRIPEVRLLDGAMTYRDGGRDTVLHVDEFSMTTADAVELDLRGSVGNFSLTAAGRIDSADALLQGREVQIQGQIATDSGRIALSGRVFQPLSFKGIDLNVQGKIDDAAALLHALGKETRLGGEATVAFDVTDRDGPVALRNVNLQMAPAPGARLKLTGGMQDAVGLRGLALDLRLTADRVSKLSEILAMDIPPLGSLVMQGNLQGQVAAPRLDGIDGRISHDSGSILDFQGAVKDVAAGKGVNLHIAARTEDAAALLRALGQKPVFKGRAEAAFDLKHLNGKLVLHNMNAEFSPLSGVEIAVGGRIDDIAARRGLALNVRVRARAAADLLALVDADIPTLAPLRAQGRIIGTLAAPSLVDLDLQAGRGDRLSLAATGTVNDVLLGTGLNLKLRLRGANSKVLSPYVQMAVPELGRFDLSARLSGDVEGPRLGRIVGRFRHDNGLNLDLRGAVGDPLHGGDLDIAFTATVPAQALSPAGAAEGEHQAGALRAAGRITGSRSAVRLDELKASFGDSDLNGQGKIDFTQEPPFLDGALHSKKFDLALLSLGDPAEEREDPDGRVIPDIALDNELPSLLQGRVSYRADRLRWGEIDLHQVETAVSLRDGTLILEPSQGQIAGGKLQAQGKFQDSAAMATFTLQGVALKRLGPMLGLDAVDGPLDLRGDLRANGQDLRTLASRLDGTVSVVVGAGEIHNRFLEPLAMDLVTGLVKGGLTGKSARLNCFASAYDIKEGKAVSRIILLDTGNITITGEGGIDLGREALEFRLVPRPKDPSLLSLATPINIRGTLADPLLTPDSKALAGSVATALAGNLLLPGVGLLLPLLNTGTGQSHPCLDVVKDGEAQASAPKAPGTLDRLGTAAGKGAKRLLELPARILGKE